MPARHRPRSPRPSPRESTAAGPQRLQKLLALAGYGSRRKCEELISTGRVEVDRQQVTQLGAKADLNTQEVRVDGQVLKLPQRHTYYAVHKPVGVVSTNYDQSGRPRVIDLIPPSSERVYTIGRLDLSSEGLILVTNDGDLANKLAHPRYGVRKTYEVLVAGHPEREALEQVQRGVYLSEGKARVSGLTVKRTFAKSTLLEMVLTEGRNREIRRVLAAVGNKVLKLKRVAIAGVKLGDLPPGAVRTLKPYELQKLQHVVGAAPADKTRGGKGRGKKKRAATASSRKPRGRR